MLRLKVMLVPTFVGILLFYARAFPHNDLISSQLEYAHKKKEEGLFLQAIEGFKLVLAFDEKHVNAHIELAQLYMDHEDYQNANLHLHKASAYSNDINVQFNIGNLCCRTGDFNHAIACYQKVLDYRPDVIQAMYNMGFAYKHNRQPDLAVEMYNQVLHMNPNYDPAHLGLAFAYLSKGDYQNGWKEHQWNLKEQKKDSPVFREFIAQKNFYGKRILIRPEGGLGDTINFIRYAQRLKNLGAYVIASVQEPLIPLLSRCKYIDKLINSRHGCPSFDATVTVMSIPALFQDTEETIENNIPYITPDLDLVNYWHEKIKDDTNFKVGICWQADVYNDSSRLPCARRGIPLSQFCKLAKIPGISWYSLQKKEGLDQLHGLPDYFELKTFENFDEQHGPFMDTAALIHHLDLVISIDTAIPHLAGALGRPVWLLLPFSIDWRWLVHRQDSPWYPTMKIFKQPHAFDWDSVIDQLELHLKSIVS